ncbi:centrosomal protein of 55 kDa-like [Antennarius striatus]|uniref:centrosomal protein of 55 kDa-like n=1 Tax=Antennarius striatus TaxID=241820 RepID=UPI0035B11A42
MTPKGAKGWFSRFFKSSSSASKAEAEVERITKENVRRKIDDLSKKHKNSPEYERTKMLERILHLETLQERNQQQFLVKEQEVEALRQQLTAKEGEVVGSLRLQLEQRRKEDERRDMMFQNLSQKTENLKNRCQSLEEQVANELAPPGDVVSAQDQLRDALEKNKQWLVYDQQREAYVQLIVARSVELEQQLAEAKKQQTNAEGSSFQEKNDELEVKMQLQAERLSNRHEASEEKKVDKMAAELKNVKIRLKEEKKRSAILLLQVDMLQGSLLGQEEEQSRIAALEQQISATDFENERTDRLTMQHQLQKMLKELHKAQSRLSKLESAKQTDTRLSEPSSHNSLALDRLDISGPRAPTSLRKYSSLLDEIFMTCPKCQKPYLARHYTELLTHIDDCTA